MKGIIMDILTSFIAGTGLGIFNYTSLWYTVKHIPFVKNPTFLSSTSYFLRMGITMAGFFLVMDGRWKNLIVCLVGFLMVRFIFVKIFQPKRQLREVPKEG